MSKKLYWLFLGGFLFASCSKEESFEQRVDNPADTTGNPSGGLLVRMVGKAEGATDSSIVTLSYNSAGKVVNLLSTTVGLVDEQYLETEVRYYRGNDGMVNRYVYVEKVRHNSSVLYQDSSVCTFHITGQHYIYAIREVPDPPGKPILDSIVYSYDNKDRISSVVVWREDEDDGIVLFDLQKTIYSYDPKSNISMMSITFKDDINTSDPPQIVSFSYGDKLAPLNLGVDGQIEGSIAHGINSPNNLMLIDNPDASDKLAYTYEFNAASRPVKGVETNLLSGVKTNVNYYYR